MQHDYLRIIQHLVEVANSIRAVMRKARLELKRLQCSLNCFDVLLNELVPDNLNTALQSSGLSSPSVSPGSKINLSLI
jgi:hypothetical protein